VGDGHLDILDEIVRICDKQIKEESDNIQQILLTLFSAYTDNPQNTRILAPSGEGKTYLVTKISQLFPQENIKIIARATPQSFKYTMSTKRVVENGTGNWQDYDSALEPLENELKTTNDPNKKDELQSQIKELIESACDLVDFTNKTIILVDSQSFELFESLKTTLSHDQEFTLIYSVNKTKSGTMKGQKFLIKGFPAVIYCSAKDEQQKDQTNEINTRFNTISLNASATKYRKMLELEAMRSSLPNSIFQQEIISEYEIKQTQEKIKQIISIIETSDQILNPFGIGLQSLLKDDAGFRTRQLKVLNNNIRMQTMINSVQRPKIILDDEKIPVTMLDDVYQASRLTKQSMEIQPYKIKQFNEYIRKFILESGTSKTIATNTVLCLTATQIAELFSIHGIYTDRQRLQETILKPLSQHGYLEEFQDPENRSRHVYAVSSQYVTTEASIESTLIDTSTLDVSCVDSFIDQFLKHRFHTGMITILDKDGSEITLETLCNVVKQIDAQHPKNRHKIDNIEASISIDNQDDV
jgi:hypothetical protein